MRALSRSDNIQSRELIILFTDMAKTKQAPGSSPICLSGK
jgi:hypothetical protein